MIENIKSGSLAFQRKDSKGELIRGLLKQGEKGIIEQSAD
jgi:hypothetical protein